MTNNNLKDKLITKIKNHKATVGIIGLGYVGLPLALRFSEEFSCVYGFDIDEKKVSDLNSGNSYIKQITNDRVSKAIKNGLLATSNYDLVSECDAIIICVPTPLTKHYEPDLSFVRITTETIVPNLRPGQIIILESTTFPGTTEELLAPRIEHRNLAIGKDVFLAYSPEREDPGNITFSTHNIPKVIGGHTENCLDVGIALYGQVIEQIVPVSSTKVAEMTKLLENIHRAVNIGLVNEMKIVADKMGIDIHEVIDAAATKPFGFTKFSPGPGLGGHCIPIDPFYLTWKAKEFGVNTRFIELAGEINRYMPQWVVNRTIDCLNNNGLPVKGSRILILGVAYKKNVDDMRESPSVEIMELLREKGADVNYSDPFVPQFPVMRAHSFNLTSVSLTPNNLKKYDVIILATDHDLFEYELIEKSATLIIDTRGRFPKNSHNIVRA